MKLIFAIINHDDSSTVASELTKAGFFFTKFSSKGGFLRAGNKTFMMCTEDEKVDEAISIISNFSKRRSQLSPSAVSFTSDDISAYGRYPIEVSVGGATVFVSNVERFEKL